MTPSVSAYHDTGEKFSPLASNLIVLLSYLLLSAVYTYPLIVYMRAMLPVDSAFIND